ncbi:MAG: hypothetical protein O7C75_13495 [Verrucomicrobia bacterium]|nr:hypothetical protein [Verrucomicrobiota bacterium]
MIKLGPRPNVPPSLNGKTVLKKKVEIEQKIADGQKIKSEDFPSYWLNVDVREPLWAIHHGKCCYCERKREIKRESDVEHYRPKSAVTKESNHPGYWWLAYEWTNYLYSCKPCNETHKGNFFPLLEGSPRATGPNQDTASERPVLINPIDDDPESCISYNWWDGAGIYVKALGCDDEGRGSDTIKILSLNRLMEDRAELLGLLMNLAQSMIHAQRQNNQQMVDKFATDIRSSTSAKKQLAGFRRAFFKAQGLAEYVATD